MTVIESRFTIRQFAERWLRGLHLHLFVQEKQDIHFSKTLTVEPDTQGTSVHWQWPGLNIVPTSIFLFLKLHTAVIYNNIIIINSDDDDNDDDN